MAAPSVACVHHRGRTNRDFYTNPLSPNCRKVDAVAKQLGVELNAKIIDVLKGENRSPARQGSA